MKIAKSVTTGKYHRYAGESPCVTACNYSGQARRSRNVVATAEDAAKALESSFCRKCFPSGKPGKRPGATVQELANAHRHEDHQQ